MLRRVVESPAGLSVFSLTQRHEQSARASGSELLGYADDATEAGALDPARSPAAAHRHAARPRGQPDPFSGTPTYKSIADLPLAERVSAMQDPAVRARILAEDPIAAEPSR